MIRLHPSPIIDNHGISLNSTEKSPSSFREISVSFRGLKTASPFGCGAAALGCVHENMKSESESLIPREGRHRAAAEGNCVAAMRGGEQPEAEEQSRSETMLNSIRRAALASLPQQGEACRASGDVDLPRELPKAESASAGCDWSGNVRKVSCDKWRLPDGALTPDGQQSVHSSVEAGQRRWNEGTQEGECAKSVQPEDKASGVSARTRQGAEVSRRGAEPAVWTERMLTTLVRGVKGNQWFSLIDKVYASRTLELAWEQVKSNAGGSGVDEVTVARYAKDCPRRLLDVKERLKQARYQPRPVKRVWIPKAGTREKRPLGIPTVEDRIVQTALRMVIEPIFERDFSERSHGFRPGRGCKDALREVERLLNSGHHHVVDADIKGYFDAIPKERMMRLVEAKIADGRVLALIRSYLDQGIMEGGVEQEAGERGTPQGAVLSPLLANIYLDPFDHHMDKRGARLVRYADDFVVMCKSEEEAGELLEAVRAWMEASGLTLHPTKTRIVDASQPGGFDFLGYHFERGRKWPCEKSRDKFKDKIRELTPRNSGGSMAQIIVKVNGHLRGWCEYFKHSWRRRLSEYDKYVRGRMRSILRRRAGKRGRGRWKDHERWPNRYFTEAGLFSVMQAHVLACQSRE